MSFSPLIHNKSLFNKPVLKWFEMPFTPLINGARHLTALLREPVFKNDAPRQPAFNEKVFSLSFVARKLFHASFASLELGGIAAAAYHLNKTRKFMGNPALFLAASILTTLVDAYLQSPSKIYITSVSDKIAETKLSSMEGSLQAGNIKLDGRVAKLTQDSTNTITVEGKEQVLHTAVVTFANGKEPAALKKALGATSVTTLPTELLKQSDVFLLGTKRFVIVPTHSGTTERTTLQANLQSIARAELIALPAYVAPSTTKTVESEDFKVEGTVYNPPWDNNVGFRTAQPRLDTEDLVVVDAPVTCNGTKDAPVIEVPACPLETESGWMYYVYFNDQGEIIVQYTEPNGKKRKAWSKTKLPSDWDLTQFNHWIEPKVRIFNPVNFATVQSSNFKLPEDLIYGNGSDASKEKLNRNDVVVEKTSTKLVADNEGMTVSVPFHCEIQHVGKEQSCSIRTFLSPKEQALYVYHTVTDRNQKQVGFGAWVKYDASAFTEVGFDQIAMLEYDKNSSSKDMAVYQVINKDSVPTKTDAQTWVDRNISGAKAAVNVLTGQDIEVTDLAGMFDSTEDYEVRDDLALSDLLKENKLSIPLHEKDHTVEGMIVVDNKLLIQVGNGDNGYVASMPYKDELKDRRAKSSHTDSNETTAVFVVSTIDAREFFATHIRSAVNIADLQQPTSTDASNALTKAFTSVDLYVASKPREVEGQKVTLNALKDDTIEAIFVVDGKLIVKIGNGNTGSLHAIDLKGLVPTGFSVNNDESAEEKIVIDLTVAAPSETKDTETNTPTVVNLTSLVTGQQDVFFAVAPTTFQNATKLPNVTGLEHKDSLMGALDTSNEDEITLQLPKEKLESPLAHVFVTQQNDQLVVKVVDQDENAGYYASLDLPSNFNKNDYEVQWKDDENNFVVVFTKKKAEPEPVTTTSSSVKSKVVDITWAAENLKFSEDAVFTVFEGSGASVTGIKATDIAAEKTLTKELKQTPDIDTASEGKVIITLDKNPESVPMGQTTSFFYYDEVTNTLLSKVSNKAHEGYYFTYTVPSEQGNHRLASAEKQGNSFVITLTAVK